MIEAKWEHRSISTEIRAKQQRAEGYAAVFNKEAHLGGGLRERIDPGAFTEALQRNDILALQDHSPQIMLGRTKSGTLRLSEDSTGLAFSLDLPDTSAGRDVRELLERGDIGGMSIGFYIRAGGAKWVGKGQELRVLKKVDLVECSIISGFPAYADTSVALRNLHRMNDHDRRRRLLMLAESQRWV